MPGEQRLQHQQLQRRLFVMKDTMAATPAPETRGYLASLPERSARALAALGPGIVHEMASLLLPAGLRRSRLYQATVGRLLRILIEGVGGVSGAFPAEALSVNELVIRKAAGNAVELASFLAVGWSPIWLLAAVSDLTGGTRMYLQALVAELETSGALPAGTQIASFEELLGALEGTSGTLADNIDLIPTSLRELRAAWDQLRQHVAELPDADRLAALFADLQAAATREGRSLLQISALIALGAVRAGVQLGHAHIFSYYRDTLRSIIAEGLPRYLRRLSAPYLVGAVGHLDRRRDSYTQRLLRRLSGRASRQQG
jgi:hypothetical protein